MSGSATRTEMSVEVHTVAGSSSRSMTEKALSVRIERFGEQALQAQIQFGVNVGRGKNFVGGSPMLMFFGCGEQHHVIAAALSKTELSHTAANSTLGSEPHLHTRDRCIHINSVFSFPHF